MLVLVAIVLAIFVLPAPWSWIAVATAAIVDTVETLVLIRWSKRRRAVVGLETLVGRTAVVVTALAPQGQVKLDGEVWEARAPLELPVGAEVVVRSVEGLILDVAPMPPS